MTAAGAGTAAWLDSVTELDPERWCELAQGADIEYDRGYLSYLEAVEPGGRPMLVLRDRHGDYLAGCALSQLSGRTARASRAFSVITDSRLLWLPETTTALPEDLQAVLERHTGHAPGGLDDGLRHARDALSQIVGIPLAVRSMWDSSLLVAPALAGKERRQAMAALLTALLREALRRGHRSVAFLYVRAADPDLARILTAAGFVSGTVRGVSRIRLDGCRTVEDYLRRFSQRHRSKLRREARAAAAVGRLDHADPAVLGQVAALEHANSARYGRPVSAADLRLVHDRLAEHVPDRVLQYGVVRDGRIVAALLALRGERKICTLAYGADYQNIGHANGLYGPTGFARPIADAVAAGLQAVELGADAYAPKVLRGARLDELRMYLWSAAPAGLAFARDWLAVVDARVKAGFDEVRGLYPGRDWTPADEEAKS